MDEKISSRAIEQYASVFASKLADQFFQKKDKITGQEILTLCDIKQVNLFVVKELMSRWKQESEKWQSPYFDYEAEAVKRAQREFQIALSNHILIAKADFLPLLKTGVSQTLHVLFAPYDFYADLLDSEKGLLRVADLKEETRYLRINKGPIDKLVERFEQRKVEVITRNEAFAALDQVLEEVNFSPEDIDGHVAMFSNVVLLNIPDLFEPKEVKTPVAKPVTAPTPPPVQPKPKEPTAPVVDQRAGMFKIKDSLTINQKFMFTKMLFSGDFELFTSAIDRLDNLDTWRQAVDYIRDNYPHWDPDSEEYEEFIAVVRRKFS